MTSPPPRTLLAHLRPTRDRLTLAATCVACFVIGAASPFVHPPIGQWALGLDPQAPPWVQRARKLDPRLGEVLRIEGLRTPGGEPAIVPPAGRKTCLVALWGCGSCSAAQKLSDLQRIAADTPGLRLIILAVPVQGESLEPYLGHPGIEVVTDPTGVASRRLNASVPGRTYLFAADGRLTAVSGHGETWSRTTDRIRAFARR
jgi:hypothetical protein